MKVLVTGAAGKLGSMLAGKMVQLGHEVFVLDRDEEAIDHLLKIGPLHHDDDPNFTKCKKYDGDEVDVELIVVDTPTDPNTGRFDVSKVQQCIDRRLSAYTIVVSTVNPGDIPEGVIYNPTMIALGEIDFERFLFAGIDRPEQEQLLNELWQQPVKCVTRREAEIVKLGINCFLSLKISFFNAMGMLAKWYQANPNEVCKLIGTDERVGLALTRPGLPFGGPCLPRDVECMSRHALKLPGDALYDLMMSVKCVNTELISDAMDAVYSADTGGKDEPTIGIIGMSYKPGVPYDWESFGIQLHKMLTAEFDNANVYTYCPWCRKHNDERVFSADIIFDIHGAMSWAKQHSSLVPAVSSQVISLPS